MQKLFLSALLLLCISNQSYAFDSKIPEKNEFIERVYSQLNSGYPNEQKLAVRSLTRKGITQPLIYQRIAELIEQYSAEDNKDNLDLLGWLVKGLAFSGNDAYRSTIAKFAETDQGRLKKHAKQALEILDESKTLNLILSNEDLYTGTEDWQAILDANTVRFVNDFQELENIARKFLNYKFHEPVVFRMMNERVLSDYQFESKNKAKIQAYAYMLKAMMYFPRPEYVETIRLVSEQAGDKKLVSYAKEYYEKKGQLFTELRQLKQSGIYQGQKFGVVHVGFKGLENPEPNKAKSLQKMDLEQEIKTMLEYIELFDENSTNTLNIEITDYRVRSKGSKAAAILFIPGAEQLGTGVIGPDVIVADVSLIISSQTNLGEPDFSVSSVDVDLLSRNKSGEAFLAGRFVAALNEKLESALLYLQ